MVVIAATDKALKTTLGSMPVPQVFDETLNDWVPTKGTGGVPDVRATITSVTMTDAQAFPTRSAGMVSLQTNAVTVTTGQVELKASTSAMAGRKQLLVYAPTVGTVYWGPTGVTSATGAPLTTGDAPLSFDLDPTTPLAIYAVSDGTDRIVRVVEAK